MRHKRFKQKCFNETIEVQTVLFHLVLALIGGVFIFGLLGGAAYAKADSEAEITKVVTREVVGEIISFNPIKNPQFIGIASIRSDVYLRIGEDIKVIHKDSLDEIKLGDRIVVTYDEVTEVTEEGKELTKRVAKVIRFVKPAMRKIRREPGDAGQSEEPREFGVLRSY